MDRKRCGCTDPDPDICRSDEDEPDEAYVCDCPCHDIEPDSGVKDPHDLSSPSRRPQL